MDFSHVICPACRKQVKEPINLICDHHLCFKCAEKLLTVDSESQYQRKYRLACPSCKRSTVTYDLRHLIISYTEYDEDLYVTTKYISDKPEIKVKSPRFDLTKNKETDSPLMKYACKKPSVHSDSERGSSNHKQSATVTPKTSAVSISVKCSSHYNTLKYFCEQDKSLLCSQCVKWHKDHRMCQLKNVHEMITSQNGKSKEDSKTKLHEVKKYIIAANQNKKMLSSEFESLLSNLDNQFKWLQDELRKKHQELSTSLKNIYMMKIEEQSMILTDLTELQKNLQEYSDYNLKDFDSHVYFFNLYTSSRKKLTLQPPVQKAISYVWQKNKEGFYDAIDKFMRLKQTSSGKPPIGTSSDHQRKKSTHNASYMDMLSGNVSRKGSSVCEDDVKEVRQPGSSKGSKEKENYKPSPSNVLQLDLKRLKF